MLSSCNIRALIIWNQLISMDIPDHYFYKCAAYRVKLHIQTSTGRINLLKEFQ